MSLLSPDYDTEQISSAVTPLTLRE